MGKIKISLITLFLIIIQFKLFAWGSSYENFIGNYNLFDHKIEIFKSENDKLNFRFKDINLKDLKIDLSNINEQIKTLEEVIFYNKMKDYFSKEFMENLNSSLLFPYDKNYELVPIGDSNFVIKDSGGYTLSLKDKEPLNLILRDFNGKEISKVELEKILKKEELINLVSYMNSVALKVLNYRLSDLYDGDINKISPKLLRAILQRNMQNLQGMLWTFYYDFGNIFPTDLELLIKEANNKQYWKSIINPFNKEDRLNIVFQGQYVNEIFKGSVMLFEEYKKNNEIKDKLKGLILYEPLNCSEKKEMNYCSNSEYKINACKNYKIYATDENGELLKNEKNEILVLSDK